MTFIPITPKVPTLPEELFVHDGKDNVAFLVAVLQDGSRLFLSDGPGQNFPSVWPLWYEPYTIEHSGALVWLEKRRTLTLRLRPDMTDIYTHMHPRGLGFYYGIAGVELGTQPWLEHWVNGGYTSRQERLEYDMFCFPSPIVEFIPVASREEAQHITPS